MNRTLLSIALLCLLAGCTSSARFVERRPDGGVIAVPDYKHRDDALSLLEDEYGHRAAIVREEEVVTGSDVKTVTEVGNGSIFQRIGAWFTGTEKVATTDVKTNKSTEWRITYVTQPGSP